MTPIKIVRVGRLSYSDEGRLVSEWLRSCGLERRADVLRISLSHAILPHLAKGHGFRFVRELIDQEREEEFFRRAGENLVALRRTMAALSPKGNESLFNAAHFSWLYDLFLFESLTALAEEHVKKGGEVVAILDDPFEHSNVVVDPPRGWEEVRLHEKPRRSLAHKLRLGVLKEKLLRLKALWSVRQQTSAVPRPALFHPSKRSLPRFTWLRTRRRIAPGWGSLSLRKRIEYRLQLSLRVPIILWDRLSYRHVRRFPAGAPVWRTRPRLEMNLMMRAVYLIRQTIVSAPGAMRDLASTWHPREFLSRWWQTIVGTARRLAASYRKLRLLPERRRAPEAESGRRFKSGRAGRHPLVYRIVLWTYAVRVWLKSLPDRMMEAVRSLRLPRPSEWWQRNAGVGRRLAASTRKLRFAPVRRKAPEADLGHRFESRRAGHHPLVYRIVLWTYAVRAWLKYLPDRITQTPTSLSASSRRPDELFRRWRNSVRGVPSLRTATIRMAELAKRKARRSQRGGLRRTKYGLLFAVHLAARFFEGVGSLSVHLVMSVFRPVKTVRKLADAAMRSLAWLDSRTRLGRLSIRYRSSVISHSIVVGVRKLPLVAADYLSLLSQPRVAALKAKKKLVSIGLVLIRGVAVAILWFGNLITRAGRAFLAGIAATEDGIRTTLRILLAFAGWILTLPLQAVRFAGSALATGRKGGQERWERGADFSHVFLGGNSFLAMMARDVVRLRQRLRSLAAAIAGVRSQTWRLIVFIAWKSTFVWKPFAFMLRKVKSAWDGFVQRSRIVQKIAHQEHRFKEEERRLGKGNPFAFSTHNSSDHHPSVLMLLDDSGSGVNVTSAIRLAEAFRERGIRPIVLTSTSYTYQKFLEAGVTSYMTPMEVRPQRYLRFLRRHAWLVALMYLHLLFRRSVPVRLFVNRWQYSVHGFLAWAMSVVDSIAYLDGMYNFEAGIGVGERNFAPSAGLTYLRHARRPTFGVAPILHTDQPSCVGPFPAEHHLVYGTQALELFRKQGIPEKYYHVVGTEHYDRCYRREKRDDEEVVRELVPNLAGKKLVVVLTEAMPHQMTEIRPCMKVLTGMKDVVSVLKLHPDDKIEVFRELLEELGNPPNVTLLAAADVHALVHACDLVIAKFSNVVIEAAVMGTPTLVANFADTPPPLDYVAEGLSFGARTPEQFSDLVQKLLRDDTFRREAVAKLAHVGRFNGPNDGLSSERIVNFVLQRTTSVVQGEGRMRGNEDDEHIIPSDLRGSIHHGTAAG